MFLPNVYKINKNTGTQIWSYVKNILDAQISKFFIVLKVKYWGSKSHFLTENALFCWLSVANFDKNDRKHGNFG